MSYDKNGNILSLQRQGHTNANATSFGAMDKLVYGYHNGGNQLRNVADNNASDTYGFKDVNGGGTEYQYDANGNMTSDLNKGIAVNGIEYNFLNMPTKITVSNAGSNNGTIELVYSAEGTKIQKRTTQGGSTTTTDYNGDYVYENGVLKQITQAEGYIEPNGSSWQYVYRLTDIWGNTRITYADDNGDGSIDASSEIRREQNYYPFGLEHKGYNNVLNGVKNNLKTYQKQEFTEDLGLNTHEWRYRMSDPAIGRFWQIDPLAEDYVYNSTYAFQENKMGMGIELEGLELKEFIFNDTGKGKPVLTFGLHRIKLPKAERSEGGGAVAFAGNVLKSIYNGAVDTFEAGMNGANAGDLASEGLGQTAELADRVIEGEATVQDAENLVAAGAMAVVRGKLGSKGNGKKFNGQADTNSKTSREAFRNAKDQNGIPRSQQPDKTFNTPDKNTGQNLKTFEFTNSNGEKVQIRKDRPRTFPDGGSQGPHFNAGKAGGKLKQHHNHKDDRN